MSGLAVAEFEDVGKFYPTGVFGRGRRLAVEHITLRINAAGRENGISYSKLIGALKKSKIGLDRKSLAHLAKEHPEAFARILKQLN